VSKLMATAKWNRKATYGICPVPRCGFWKVSLRAITAHLAKKHGLRINWKQIGDPR
jgi:hypothetical protein